MDEIKEAQGWNNETMLTLAEEFISDRNLMDDFCKFLQDRADEENAESEE